MPECIASASDVAVDRLAQLGAVEAALDRRPRDVERVEREHVVVDERVVPRRERAVVAEVVAGQLRVAGEPAGVVVDAVARASKPGTATAGPALAARREAAAERASAIALVAAGRSASSQWKKSTRGRSAGISRPGWLTSSPRLGTSKSWQISDQRLRCRGQLAPGQVRVDVVGEGRRRRTVEPAARVARRDALAVAASCRSRAS